MADNTLKNILDCIIEDGVDFVCENISFNMPVDYDVIDDDIMYMIRDYAEEYVSQFDAGVIFASVCNTREDCESVLRALGVGFEEMKRLNQLYGCVTVEKCAECAVYDWFMAYGSIQSIDEITDKVLEMYKQDRDFSF